ncbi:MAG TPA: LCP family protein [Actinomycetota bacterium]|nr:LCP family protein [Actinomycetota bacterium]
MSDRKSSAVPAGRWENLEALGRAVRTGGSPSAPPRPPGNRATTRTRGRRLRRLAVVAIALLLVLGLVALFFGWRIVSQIVSRNAQSVENLSPSKGADNFLLVGSDTRDGLSKQVLGRVGTVAVSGQRTDTIILVHVSPRNRKAVMVSIPRDLKVDIPDHGTNKINAAYAFGGPDLLVKTIERNLGVPINHYAEIDFAGFLKVVDAVGGVRLCNQTGRRLDDNFANLHMDPGCHEMNGVQALAFVRARHIDSDFGRIGRQQQFLRAVMEKASSTGNLINLPKLVRIANIVSDHLKTDDTLRTTQAIALARRIGRLDGSSVDMRVYPSAADGPSFVTARPEAPILMKAIAGDASRLPPVGLPNGKGVTLADLRVAVLNGGGVQGAAAQTADRLRAYGLRIVQTGNATSPTGQESTLTYPAAKAQQARLLSSLLGDQVKLVESGASTDGGSWGSGTLILTVGSSFHLAAPPGG